MNTIKQWANNFEHIEYNTTHNTISGSTVQSLISNPYRWFTNLKIKSSNSAITQAMKTGMIYEQQIIKTLVGDKQYELIMHEDEDGNNLPYIQQTIGKLEMIATFDALDVKNNTIYEIKTTGQPHDKFLSDARYQLALYMKMYDNKDAKIVFATYNPNENKPLTKENIMVTILTFEDVKPWIEDIDRALLFVKEKIWDYEKDVIKNLPKATIEQVEEEIDYDNLMESYQGIQGNIKALNKALSDAKLTLANLEKQIKFAAATKKDFGYKLAWTTKVNRTIKTTIQGYKFELELEKRE